MKPRLKIAILSYYSGSVSRGVETFVTEISQRLSTSFAITVYHQDFKQNNRSTIKQFTQKTLVQLELDPPDILMALNNGWMSLLSKIFCLKHKTKLILVGLAGIGWIDRLNLWLMPDRFICCTQAQAAWAKRVNPLAAVSVIHFGVNTDRFKPEGKKFPLELAPPIVLCVAGPEPYKRVDKTIQAVARLGKTSLLVVGRQTDKIKALGEKLLGRRYHNLSVSYNQVDQVYRSVNLFTLASKSTEAYGISILEALASGLAVVVNNDPIRKELVGRAGILVDPADIDNYSLALKANISQKNNPIFRQQALKFSWDKISRQYQKLWLSLAG